MTGQGIEAVDAAFEAAMVAMLACRRLIPPGVADVSLAYLDGARRALLNAREEFRHATTRDIGERWRARIMGSGVFQVGGHGSRLSETEFLDDDGDPAEGSPDLGASLMLSQELADCCRSSAFSALLASALADHAWMHLGSATTWMASWPAAEALVRARNGGRWFPRVSHREMHDSVDRRVAEQLAAIGWRRLSAPRHLRKR